MYSENYLKQILNYYPEKKCSFDWKVKCIVNWALYQRNPMTRNRFHLCVYAEKDGAL